MVDKVCHEACVFHLIHEKSEYLKPAVSLYVFDCRILRERMNSPSQMIAKLWPFLSFLWSQRM